MIIHLIKLNFISSITSFHFSLTKPKLFFDAITPEVIIKPSASQIKIFLLLKESQKNFNVSSSEIWSTSTNNGIHGNTGYLKTYKENIPVFVSSWQKHVESWISYLSKFPSLIIRYDDLVYSKEKVINTILEFFEKNYNIVLDNKNFKIKNVIKTTEFSRMKEEEKTKGFVLGERGTLLRWIG